MAMLARRFRQNAIVVAKVGAPARLVKSTYGAADPAGADACAASGMR